MTSFEWAIGTEPEGTDIQDFVVPEDDEFAINTELKGLLKNHQTYYVTLRCGNGAGLVSVQSSNGEYDFTSITALH